MRIPQAPESEITDEAIFLNRRDLLRLGTTAVIGSALAGCPATDEAVARSAHTRDASTLPRLSDVQPAPPAYRVDEKITRESDATGYNNFYEFGTDKKDPARNAHTYAPSPGPSSSMARSESQAEYRSKRSSHRLHSRNESIDFAASRHGPWSYPGSASRFAMCSSASSLRRRRAMSPLKHFSTLYRCQDSDEV